MAQDDRTYGFSKVDARALIESIGGAEGGVRDSPNRQQVVHRILKTPGGGIAARTGVACGSATCTEYYVDGSGDIVVTGGSYTVFNIFGSAIGPDAYITAKLVRGKWIADAEDCS